MQRNAIYPALAMALLFSTAALATPVTYQFSAVQTFDSSHVATGYMTFDDHPLDISASFPTTGSCGRPTCSTYVSNPLLSLSMEVNGVAVDFGSVTTSQSHVYIDNFNQTPSGPDDTRDWFFFTEASFSNSIGLNSVIIQMPVICVLPSCPPSTWDDMMAVDDIVPGVTDTGPLQAGGILDSILLEFNGGFGNPNNPANGGVPNYEFKSVHKVPEPSTLVLMGVGLLGLLIRRRRSAPTV